MAITDSFKSMGLGQGLGFDMSSMLNIFFVIIMIILILGVLAVVGWFVYRRLKFNYKICIYKEINGVVRKIGEDNGGFFKISKKGDLVLKLRKNKTKVFTYPSKFVGNKEIWYFIKADSDWINIGVQDINLELGQLGINFTNGDMRMENIAIAKILEAELQPIDWLKKNLPLLMAFGMVFLVIIGLVILFKGMDDINQSAIASQSMAQETMIMAQDIGVALNNIANNMGDTSDSREVERGEG